MPSQSPMIPQEWKHESWPEDPGFPPAPNPAELLASPWVGPPRVEYELTALGRSLREPLTALGRWAEEHISEVLDARDAYDERPGTRVLP
ncbi:winged helix-turn-helix transcriptional regulator [Arthrobacter sp. YC-RL1]|uniref:winged helix-turn-helix transcriptional regulator n=1 Tax=Arthrobacter sp. YC-RL1 TaxID=1652545 RepID=UPI0009E304D5